MNTAWCSERRQMVTSETFWSRFVAFSPMRHRTSILSLWCTVHTDTQCCTLNWLQCLLFWLLCKLRWVYLSFHFLVFVVWLSTLLTIHFFILLVCALYSFLYPFSFKHAYFWLPYASAAVSDSVANSVTGFARYFSGDCTFLHTR